MGKALNKPGLLVDTDVVVDYLREVSDAVACRDRALRMECHKLPGSSFKELFCVLLEVVQRCELFVARAR